MCFNFGQKNFKNSVVKPSRPGDDPFLNIFSAVDASSMVICPSHSSFSFSVSLGILHFSIKLFILQ